ncbi:MAG TPA: arylesterase [Gemmatimonadaceae bacterium]|nr:arylesterase [Gemmatimonadaceae bacterium]
MRSARASVKGTRQSRVRRWPVRWMVVAFLGVATACGGGESARARAEAPGAPDTASATDGAVGIAPKDSLATTGAAATGQGSADSVARPRVLIAGTSLTAGLGLDPTMAYPALLQRKADSAGFAVRIENAGLSGETSAGLLRRIDWLLREPAAMVVVETGANDGLRGLSVETLAANLRRIVERIHELQPAARVYLVQMEAPPNFGPTYTRRFHDVYGAVARETGATLLPFLLEGVAGVRALNQADGIHPNGEGAARVAATLWRPLAPVLDSLDRARPEG